MHWLWHNILPDHCKLAHSHVQLKWFLNLIFIQSPSRWCICMCMYDPPQVSVHTYCRGECITSYHEYLSLVQMAKKYSITGVSLQRMYYCNTRTNMVTYNTDNEKNQDIKPQHRETFYQDCKLKSKLNILSITENLW